MPNRFQVKRTTTTGLLPNVSNSSNTSYIAAGELAINLTDRKLLSSNGSATFEIGANLATIVVGTGFTQTSGNANFDSGVLFVDGTNNRVGIGNTTPAHALSVTGTTNLGGVVTITSNATLSGTNTHITSTNTSITSNVTISGTLAAGNTTVTGFANVSGIVSADYYTASNNGNGTNYRIGDDAWLGDINSADTVGLKGQQNASYGYIKFGAAPTSLGYNGTSLIYSSNVSFGNTSVNGAITATGDITAFFSDDRLKDRYSNIPNAVEKVQSLNGFYYEPNITAQDLGYQKEMHVGVSAQEVNAIMPEIVAPAPIDNKYMTVKYDRLIPLLIEAIKEQQIQIDELKAQLNKD